MPIISVSIPDDLLALLDKTVIEKGYKSRSELIREALEEKLRPEAEKGKLRLIIVQSNHHKHPRVDQKIMEHAYRAAGELVGLYHQVLYEGKCLTMILVQEGPAAGALTSKIRSLKGVEKVTVMTV